MTWFKVDDALAFHQKALLAGNPAMGLWVRAGSWCGQQLADGFVPDQIAGMLGTPEQADALVAAGLWVHADGGYHFHQWGEHQPTRADVEERRERDRERKAQWREAKAAKAGVSQRDSERTDGVTPHGIQKKSALPDPSRPDPSRPDPTPSIRPETDPTLDAFEDAWTHWPKKEKKKQALAKFRSAAKTRSLDELAGDIAAFGDAYKASGREMKFIPGLDTWLNQERWDESLPQPERQQSSAHDRQRARQAENLAVVQHFMGDGSEPNVWEIEA